MEIFCSVGMVLNFWLSLGFGTETSVPVVLVSRFWFLLLHTRVPVQGFQGVYLHLSHFATSLVPCRYHSGFKSGGTLRFSNWNLN